MSKVLVDCLKHILPILIYDTPFGLKCLITCNILVAYEVLHSMKSNTHGRVGQVCERPRPQLPFYRMLGQTHVNGWSHVVASQNGGLTSYIFPLKLRVLQWSCHLFNY